MTRTKATKRRVFDLKWSKRNGWALHERGKGIDRSYAGFNTDEALIFARVRCRAIHGGGDLVQLVVRTRSGRIRFEHTYGRDPRSKKG